MSDKKFDYLIQKALESSSPKHTPDADEVWKNISEKLDNQEFASETLAKSKVSSYIFYTLAGIAIATGLFFAWPNKNKETKEILTPKIAENIEAINDENLESIAQISDEIEPKAEEKVVSELVEEKKIKNTEKENSKVESAIKSKNNLTISLSKTSACAQEIIAFKPSFVNKAYTYEWHFGDGMVSDQTSPSHRFENAGTYTAQLKITHKKSGKVILADYPVSAMIHPKPNALFEYACTEVDLHNPALCFKAMDESAVKYSWNFGDGNFSSSKSPKHLFTQKGHYGVKLFVENEFGCSDSSKQQVRVIRGYNLMALPSFAPTKESGWLPLALKSNSKKFHLKIMNDQGVVLFESTDANETWNGKTTENNIAATGENFLWFASVWDAEGSKSEFAGSIEIVE